MIVVSRPTLPEADNVGAGIAWMLATMVFFVGIDATAKHLLVTYPLVQVMWGRFFFHLLVVVALTGPRFITRLGTRVPALQAARSLLLLTTTGLFFAGLRTVQLAEASAIMFLAPIIMTVLSVPILGEMVGVRRWTGVAVGFAGAMIIVRPGGGFMEVGAALLLTAAVSNAAYQLITRKIRGVDHPMTTLFYTALAGTVVLSAAAPFAWVTPTWTDWGLMALTGVCGGLGHLCLIRAFQSAPAAAVAPFSYTGLVWATIFGFTMFGDLPDRWTAVGATVIAASGLYIFYREQSLARRRPVP